MICSIEGCQDQAHWLVGIGMERIKVCWRCRDELIALYGYHLWGST